MALLEAMAEDTQAMVTMAEAVDTDTEIVTFTQTHTRYLDRQAVRDAQFQDRIATLSPEAQSRIAEVRLSAEMVLPQARLDTEINRIVREFGLEASDLNGNDAPEDGS